MIIFEKYKRILFSIFVLFSVFSASLQAFLDYNKLSRLRLRAEAITTYTDELSGESLLIHWNANMYDEDERFDDFAYKNRTIDEVFNSYSESTLQNGYVFFHAIARNDNNSELRLKIENVDIFFAFNVNSVEPDIFNNPGSLSLPADKIFKSFSKQRQMKPFDGNPPIIQQRYFEFDENNAVIGKELRKKDNYVVIPPRSSVLIKWYATEQNINFPDLLPKGEIPKRGPYSSDYVYGDFFEKFDGKTDNYFLDVVRDVRTSEALHVLFESVIDTQIVLVNDLFIDIDGWDITNSTFFAAHQPTRFVAAFPKD